MYRISEIILVNKYRLKTKKQIQTNRYTLKLTQTFVSSLVNFNR